MKPLRANVAHAESKGYARATLSPTPNARVQRVCAKEMFMEYLFFISFNRTTLLAWAAGNEAEDFFFREVK